MNRRFLRIAGIALGVTAFAGYFAFSTFLFSPLEAGYEYHVSTLIPRNVDIYLAKESLVDDFDGFPRLAVADRIEASRAGREFLGSPEWETFRTENGIDEALAGLDEALASLPIQLDLLSVFGGRQVAAAAYLQGADFAQSRWAIYGRANWMGKLGVEMLGHPGLLGLEAQGMAVAEEGGVTTLSGGQLTEPLHFTRIQDVVVVGNDAGLVSGAIDLESKSGMDSFGQSARYADHIERIKQSDGELELFVDYLALAKNMNWAQGWPNLRSEDWGEAFAARIFQTTTFKELTGVLAFGKGASLQAHGEFSSELMTPAQSRIYRQAKGIDKQLFKDRVATFIPRDCGVAFYVQTDLEELLRQALAACDSATLSLIEDPIRTVWGFPGADDMVAELGQTFIDSGLYLMRKNDYPPDPEGPPHSDDPVAVWAVVLWMKSETKAENLRKKILSNQSMLGIQGREPGSTGVFDFKIAGGGFKAQEYWSQAVPGTGHIASVEVADAFIVSNHSRFLEQIIECYLEGGTQHPRLTDNPVFSELLYEGLPSAAATLWVAPRELGDDLRKSLRQEAENTDFIDMRKVRGQLQREVLQASYGGRPFARLTPDEQEACESEVDQRIRAHVDEVKKVEVPKLYQQLERQVVYGEAVQGALLQLALRPKDFDLKLGTRIPLEE